MKTVRNATCRMCDSNEFEEVINLGSHPLVNSLISQDDLDKQEPVFPLVVEQCARCRLVQLVNIISAEEIYKNVDYLYFSSDMPTLEDYFREYADDVKYRFLASGDFFLEIGSNDGLMLKLMSDRAKVLGVDPATNVVLRALKRGLPTIPDFFNESLAIKIAREWGKAKVVMGNNCIAHLNDLRNLMRGVKQALASDGVFIIECNYWGGMVKNTNYSLIYHDHFSYFSLAVWQEFAKKYGMRVFDAVVTPAQGGSLRMFLCNEYEYYPETARLQTLEQEEKDTNLASSETNSRYRGNVMAKASKLKNMLQDLKDRGKRLAGYGAAAKGFTILKCSDIDSSLLDYFVDDSPAKQGLYSPVTHLPIISRSDANLRLPDYFVILAPNYADHIVEKERGFRAQGGKFIVPVGEMPIVG